MGGTVWTEVSQEISDAEDLTLTPFEKRLYYAERTS